MMLRFTKQAARQIDTAFDYIADRSPQGAASVRNRFRAVMELLEAHPFAGRATSRPGVRRFVLTPFPYIVDYRVNGDELIVMRFRHTAGKPQDAA